MRNAVITTVGILLGTPQLLLAQTPTDLKGIMGIIVGLINAIVPILFGIAIVGLLWGGAQILLNSQNPEELKKAKTLLIWGVVGLFVMVSVWGIVNVVKNTFF